jgi:hypothetical protein
MDTVLTVITVDMTATDPTGVATGDATGGAGINSTGGAGINSTKGAQVISGLGEVGFFASFLASPESQD